MSKKAKIILAVLAVAVIAGVCYWYFVAKPKKEEAKKAAAAADQAAVKSATQGAQTAREIQTSMGDAQV